MKYRVQGIAIVPLLMAVWVVGTAASIIDKETKQGVLGMEEKIRLLDDKLSRLEQKLGRLNQQLDQSKSQEDQLIRSIREEIKSIQVVLPAQTPLDPAALDTKFKVVDQKVTGLDQRLLALDQKLGQFFQQAQSEDSRVSGSLGVLQQLVSDIKNRPEAQEKTASFVVPIPNDLKKGLEKAQSFQMMAAILFGASLIFSVLTFLLLRKALLRTEQQVPSPLPEDFSPRISERPQLSLEPIGDALVLHNEGRAVADQVKILLGTALATMNHRIRVAHALKPGESTNLSVPKDLLGEESVHARLEYRHPDSGKNYKEQTSFHLPRPVIEKTLPPLRLRRSNPS